MDWELLDLKNMLAYFFFFFGKNEMIYYGDILTVDMFLLFVCGQWETF